MEKIENSEAQEPVAEEVEEVVEMARIPLKRIAELKGDADSTLKMLEKSLGVSLDVDEDGEVEIAGPSTNVFFAIPVVRAIGRGFEPRIALKLKKDEYGFRVVDLRDYAKNPTSMSRLKGRVIGEKGKAKEIIEQEAECNLAIWGHTVAIIAPLDVLDIATNAVFKLLEGQPHAGVYLYLEKNKRRRKEEELKNKGNMWK
ncbi:MAG: KH domain-containing protein [Candidatus Micrarchaeota archaeon]